MIISRPFRLSLFGDGTDFPVWSADGTVIGFDETFYICAGCRRCSRTAIASSIPRWKRSKTWPRSNTRRSAPA